MSRGLGYLERKICDLIIKSEVPEGIRSTFEISNLVRSRCDRKVDDVIQTRSHLNSIHRALSNLEKRGMLLRTSRRAFGKVYWGSPKSVWLHRLILYLEINWTDKCPDSEPFISENPEMKVIWDQMSELERNRFRDRDADSLIYYKN